MSAVALLMTTRRRSAAAVVEVPPLVARALQAKRTLAAHGITGRFVDMDKVKGGTRVRTSTTYFASFLVCFVGVLFRISSAAPEKG